jgi:biuret amidohydrolase
LDKEDMNMNEHKQVSAIIRAKNEMPVMLDPEKAALIVVDMQRYFTRPAYPFTEIFERFEPGITSGYLQRVREIVIPAIQKLLECFRGLGSSVIFTAVGTETRDGRDLPCWLRAFDEQGLAMLGSRIWPAVSDPSWQIDESVTPLASELILNKVSAGTFATTGLEQILRDMNVETVFVAGVSSDVCVSTTAREAADRNFQTIVVSDACTTLSHEMHEAALQNFNIAFGWIRTADEAIAILKK